MKTLQKTVLAAVAGTLLSVTAQASMNQAGQTYIGAKVGQFLVDESDLDDPTAFGAYAGYNFTPELSAEVEYVGSSDEEIAGIDDTEFNLKTYGAYAAYRYTFPNTDLYAKGKIGLAKAEVKASAAGFSEKDSESGIAGGIGLGYNINPSFSVESEYAYVADDVDLLTIGASYNF